MFCSLLFFYSQKYFSFFFWIKTQLIMSGELKIKIVLFSHMIKQF